MNFADYAPVRKAEAAAAASASAAAASPAPSSAVAAPPVTATAPAALATAAAVPLFVGDAVRSRAFDLEHPIAFEGRVYSAVVLRRPTSKEVGRFFEELVTETAIKPDAVLYFPVFVDEEGETIPAAVLDALDDDDRDPIMARVVDFLPRRLLALRGGRDRALAPDSGANTAPTSST